MQPDTTRPTRSAEEAPAKCPACSRTIENPGDPVCDRCQCDYCTNPHDDIWLDDSTRVCEECYAE